MCLSTFVGPYQKCSMSLQAMHKLGMLTCYIHKHFPHQVFFSHRVCMLEFLKAAHSHLSSICQQCRCWVLNTAESVHCTHLTRCSNVVDGGGGVDDDVKDTTGLLRELLMSVQRVITRHRLCATSSGEHKGQICSYVAAEYQFVLTYLQIICQTFHVVWSYT